MKRNYSKGTPKDRITTEEIKAIVSLWGKYSSQEIAVKIGRPKYTIAYIAGKIRKNGYKLPECKRNSSATVDDRIKVALKELNLI